MRRPSRPFLVATAAILPSLAILPGCDREQANKIGAGAVETGAGLVEGGVKKSNEVIDSIDWDNVGNEAGERAGDVAEFAEGFAETASKELEDANLKEIGRNTGEAARQGWEFLEGFVEGFMADPDANEEAAPGPG